MGRVWIVGVIGAGWGGGFGRSGGWQGKRSGERVVDVRPGVFEDMGGEVEEDVVVAVGGGAVGFLEG